MPGLGCETLTAIPVHVAEFSAHESFVNLDCTVSLSAISHLLARTKLFLSQRHTQANPVQHKPSRLLSDTDGAMQFPTGYAVLVVDQGPDRGQPLFERYSRVLHHSPDLDRELAVM